jgi:ribonuclease HI
MTRIFMEIIKVYTDGGARNNPGPAALGVYVETLDKGYGEYLGEKTNNEAEYAAILFGLQKVKALLGKARAKQAHVDMYMDSELAVKQLNHIYKIRERRIQEFFIEIWNEMLDFGKVTFTHVPREKNKVADRLVNEALDAELKQSKLL